MKQDYVTHRGTITQVSDGTIVIRSEDSCHCDGCAVSALCNKDSSGQAELITVRLADADRFAPGEKVEALASSSSTLSAAWWALILPTMLFIGVILVIRLGWPESGAWSIGGGFAALALYDFILYLMRRRLAGKLHWTVRRLG